jgi:hypothetical protein
MGGRHINGPSRSIQEVQVEYEEDMDEEDIEDYQQLNVQPHNASHLDPASGQPRHYLLGNSSNIILNAMPDGESQQIHYHND